MNKWIFAVFCWALTASLWAADNLQITQAWARATAPGQEVGAAYMTLKSGAPMQLVHAQASVAGAVEIHQMQMQAGVMKMRMMESLALPAGKEVKLVPGGFHFMLFDLKQPLIAGSRFELVLTIKDADGKTTQQRVKVPVKAEQ